MLRSVLCLVLLAAPASAEVPRVVTDLPLTASLVAEVMGGLGDPDVLLQGGEDPHHAQLRPSQLRALMGADLVVWIGPGLSPWLADPIDTAVTAPTLDLSGIEGQRPILLAPEDEADDHDGEGHPDHGGIDPHLWLDPGNVVLWLRAIGAALAAADPDHAAHYATRTEAAVAATLALQADLAEILEPVGDRGLVMFHDAYGYFARAYGLRIVATVTDSDATAPGAAHLSALRAGLADSGAVCLFPEANHADDFARVVIEGTTLRLGAPLDPEGMAMDGGPDLYPRLMRALAAAIADCAAGR
ncbi:MAG: zinc ABC transporter substrate-binding protein [Rhodobacteraceae bacterium]|nr:zinc ABC transporter substrate-binding protein [Paracoccaceae bacterium]